MKNNLALTLDKVEVASENEDFKQLVSYCEKLSTSLEVLKVTIDKYEIHTKNKKEKR